MTKEKRHDGSDRRAEMRGPLLHSHTFANIHAIDA